MRLDVHAHLWSTEYLDLLQAHGVHEVAAYRHLGAGLNVKDFAIAGVDGVSDAIHAVQAGEMVSILQDAKGQMQGSIDVALRAVKGESYQPQSDIWKQYAKDLKWGAARRSITTFRGPSLPQRTPKRCWTHANNPSPPGSRGACQGTCPQKKPARSGWLKGSSREYLVR